MSETLATAANNIRQKLHDTDPSRYAIDTPLTLYRIIIANAQRLASELNIGRYWISSAFTTSVNSTADYTLSSSAKYLNVYQIRDTYFGRLLTQCSLGEIETARYGITTSNLRAGDPLFFAMWEDNTQVVNIRLDRVPTRAVAMDVEVSALPSSTYTDATVLPFGDNFLRTVEYAAALEAAAGFTEDDIKRLKLGGRVLDLWASYVTEGRIAERKRLQQLSGHAVGVGAVVGI